MAINVKKEVEYLKRRYERVGNKKRAAWDKNYCRSIFKFYGVKGDDVKKIIKQFIQKNKELDKKDLWLLVRVLWESGYHELRSTAVNLLRGYLKKLDYSDLPAIERLLRQAINWDQIDEIAVHLVGPILEKDQRAFSYLKKWSIDKNFWIRRAALLSQLFLFRKKQGDRQLFYRLAVKMMDESWQNFDSWAGNHPEKMGRWFIRKTIGWVLREMSERWPEEIYNFLKTNRHKMSSLSFREGGRKLPLEYQKLLKV
ncbi:MAG: DNA alkylation repair protein [Patescibacteria group bacterium]|jgi:3-methyladenine DNA glycosylase AlkD